MTHDPEPVTGRPPGGGDVLSDVLRGVRLTGALYYRVTATSTWPPIRVPDGRLLTAAFGPRTRSVVSYHVLLEGSCWTGLADGRPVQLRAGEVVIYPHGDEYFLSCDPPRAGDAATTDDAAQLVGLLRGVSSGHAPASFTIGDGSERTTFVCGFLGCGSQAYDAVLGSLPAILHLTGTDQRLARLVELALAEVDGAPGSASVRERLSESMFLETVRQYLSKSTVLGGLTGVVDPVAARALVLMHENIRRPWTLISLASAVGVSRSVLADRFARAVGRPPMQYLGQVRMQHAEESLASSAATVSAVAREVGFGSEAAFSRAFKRSTGLAPSLWREAH